MTSSDGAGPVSDGATPAPGGAAPNDGGVAPDASGVAPTAEPVPVLAAGHLHPGILFLRLVDGVRASILPVVVALVARETWLLLVVPVYFVVTMSYALVRYLTFRYELTTEELITREGILHRQERRIPVNRVQDLNFESTLLRRMVGLVVVSVETASGHGSEARLDSLARRDASRLREALYRVRSGSLAAPAEDAPAETVLFTSTGGELTMLGLTNNRVGALIVGLFALWEIADDLGVGERVWGAGSGVIERLSHFGPVMVSLLVAAGFFLFLLAGWLLSIAASFLMFHDFTLSLRDDVLHRRYGLITTRAQTLPRRKVQRVLLEQPLLRRLLGFVVVRADSAGSGMDERQEARSGRDVIVPLTAVDRGERIVPWLLPQLDVHGLDYHRVSPRVVVRVFLKGVMLAVLLIVGAWPMAGRWALAALVILPVAWLFGFLSYRNLGHREVGDHWAFRWGILGRYRSFVPLRKVQAAILRAGPVERLLGLATLVVYVAGGSPTTLANLPRDEAARLEHEIARRAAASRFVW
jgi:putative membrane protein